MVHTVKLHSTWASCERRVKGVPGVRFKTRSTENEAKMLEDWGVLLRDVQAET